MNKQEQRLAIRHIKRHFSAEELRKMSLPILQKLENNDRFRSAKIILLYLSMADEVNTQNFVENWSKDKTILLPKVEGPDLTLHLFTSKNNLKPGAYGIMEPDGDTFSEYGKIDLAIVPGVAFDSKGFRLGRGKGFYDKLFANPAFKSVYKIGLTFPFQILDSVAHEELDVPMNEVIY